MGSDESLATVQDLVHARVAALLALTDEEVLRLPEFAVEELVFHGRSVQLLTMNHYKKGRDWLVVDAWWQGAKADGPLASEGFACESGGRRGLTRDELRFGL